MWHSEKVYHDSYWTGIGRKSDGNASDENFHITYLQRNFYQDVQQHLERYITMEIHLLMCLPQHDTFNMAYF